METFDPALELRQAAQYRALMAEFKQYEKIFNISLSGITWNGDGGGTVLSDLRQLLDTCRRAHNSIDNK